MRTVSAAEAVLRVSSFTHLTSTSAIQYNDVIYTPKLSFQQVLEVVCDEAFPCLQTISKVCHSIWYWLGLDKRHVAVMYCQANTLDFLEHHCDFPSTVISLPERFSPNRMEGLELP